MKITAKFRFTEASQNQYRHFNNMQKDNLKNGTPTNANNVLVGDSELLAAFLDWLIENPERFKPNKPSIMLADEFLKSRQ